MGCKSGESLAQSHAFHARPRGPKIQFWKAPATIAPSRALCRVFARTAQPRSTPARPRGGMGYSRTKFGLTSCRRTFLIASLRVPLARLVPSRDHVLA
ncbi:hypothetical protein PIB30_064717 [Stylosanthes scabra]|uniref:Uncharacterized protein n=1 Tax=Stylosanthes scabra TaxID=79078 RepID=A0ABU6TM21_9FABA|nr:hypothetical protein [Stylosanthes scabra]